MSGKVFTEEQINEALELVARKYSHYGDKMSFHDAMIIENVITGVWACLEKVEE